MNNRDRSMPEKNMFDEWAEYLKRVWQLQCLLPELLAEYTSTNMPYYMLLL